MAVPARLSSKLRDTLGKEAAEEMVTLMEGLQKQTDAIADVRTAIQRLDERVQGVAVRLDERVQGVELRLTKEIADVRVDLSDRIGSVRSDLMKWSFVFWVGAVAAIAALAGVIGR